MEAEINAFGVFASSFAVASFGGLAALLRSNNKISVFSTLSSMLNSGLLGLGISLLWYSQYKTEVYSLIGVCAIAGLGGSVTIEFFLKAIMSTGLKITTGQSVQISQNEDSKEKK